MSKLITIQTKDTKKTSIKPSTDINLKLRLRIGKKKKELAEARRLLTPTQRKLYDKWINHKQIAQKLFDSVVKNAELKRVHHLTSAVSSYERLTEQIEYILKTTV